MKNILRFIYDKCLKIPLPYIFLEFLEKFSSEALGKGWDGLDIKKEVKSCLSLFKNEPLVFIDIGANKGIYTNYLIHKKSDISCHLFEPSKFNFRIIEKLFYLNQKIKINKLALSNYSSKGKLFSNIEGSGLASLTKRRLDHFAIDMKLQEEVEIIRFDEYWVNYKKVIDFVKIDVEGHELNVLKGFGDFIFKTKLIQFEFGGTNIDTKTYFQDLWYFFKERQFIIFRLTPRGIKRIKSYREHDEQFIYTNYIAINKNFRKSFKDRFFS